MINFVDNKSPILEVLEHRLLASDFSLLADFVLNSPGVEDEPVWSLSSSGNFSIKSIYSQIRSSCPTSPSLQKIWHSWLPGKVSFFMWRALNQFLPFADILQSMNFNLPSRCDLCSNSEESLQHSLYECPFSKHVWKYFFGKLALGHLPSTLPDVLHFIWGHQSGNSAVGNVVTILPSLIMWEIWKCRNKAIYEGHLASLQRVCSDVERLVCDILQNRRHMATSTADHAAIQSCWGVSLRIKPARRPRLTAWAPPPFGFLKLNTDASFTRQGSSGGYVLRNTEGDLLEAGAFRLRAGDVLEAELVAFSYSIQRVSALGFTEVKVETDSLLLANYLNKGKDLPWRLKINLEGSRTFMASNGFTCSYIPRDSNAVADSLAGLGANTVSPCFFTSLSDLPPRIRGLLMLDKLGTPYIRL